jgi:hypothetical protein
MYPYNPYMMGYGDPCCYYPQQYTQQYIPIPIYYHKPAKQEYYHIHPQNTQIQSMSLNLPMSPGMMTNMMHP